MNASPMAMPTAKVSGRWLMSRSEADQSQILQLAKAFFKNDERALLQELLGNTDLRFDAEEAQVLKQRGVGVVLTGVTAGIDQEPGAPLLQFYDFCLTIDQLKNIMRGLYVHLNSKTLTQAMLKQLEPVVFYPDGVPSEIRAKVLELEEKYKNGGDEEADRKRQKCSKRQMFSITSDEVAVWKNNAAPETRKKDNTYIRCWDEAYFLRSDIANGLQALSQGLFLIFECTDAPYLTLPAMDDGRVIVNDFRLIPPNHATKHKTYLLEGTAIPLQSWINAFQYRFGTDPYLFYAVEVDAGGNPVDKFPIDTNQITILQAKSTELDKYPAYFDDPNHQWPAINNESAAQMNVPYFANVVGTSPEMINLRYNAATRYFNQSEIGGAIGKYITYKDGNGFRPQTDVGHTSFRTSEVKQDKIAQQMRRLSTHPIHACPRLADAYAKSGMLKYMMEMWLYLQRALESASHSLGAQGPPVGTVFSVDSIGSISREGIVPRCAEGMTVRYYQERSPGIYETVPEEEAYVMRNGRMELASNISRDKYDCVPRISLGEIKTKAVDEAYKFFPVIGGKLSSAPAGEDLVPVRPTIAQIRDRLQAAGGFQISNVPSRDIYGGAEMRAYISDRDLIGS